MREGRRAAAMIPLLDRIPLWAAFVPLGAYLLMLGTFHLRRRPLVVSGGADWALLGAGVTGLVLVGPLALVQPAIGNTPWSALLLVALFALLIAMGTLVSRPRLVIYNVTIDQVRPVVVDVVSRLDPSARWAGGTAALPARRLEVRIDGHGPTRTVSVVAAGERTGTDGWGEFCSRLRSGLRGLPVRSSPWAAAFLASGVLVLAVSGWFAAISLRSPAAAPHDSRELSPGGIPDARPRRSDAT